MPDRPAGPPPGPQRRTGCRMQLILLLFTLVCVTLPGVVASRWMVSLPTGRLCVWAGASVTLPCRYDYPYGLGVRTVAWFRRSVDGKQEYVFHTDAAAVSPSYTGRTRYSGTYKTCTLHLSDVRSTDGGAYYFRFETDRQGGQWTSPDAITLSVAEVQVQVHPARRSNLFAPGETVYLSCEARGCAPVGDQFALFRDAVKLASTGSLTIHNFDSRHIGTYWCRPTSLPRVRSAGVVLAVGYPPRGTAVDVSPPGVLAEGTSVTLRCSSDADPAVESYSWFKERAGGSVPDSFSPQLQLKSVGPSDGGLYYCVARNSLGGEKSPPVLLNITHVPRDTAVSAEPPGEVTEGSAVTLICSSTANPPVIKYAWFLVAGTQSLQRGATQNLTFPSVRAHHGGRYFCTVWNPRGQDSSAPFALTVLYAPRNTSASAWPSSEIEAGGSVTLTCSSSASPAVENFTWFRIDGADSRETRSGPSYTIGAISPRQGGRYYCEARNRLGAHSSPVLTVRVRGRLKVVALASAVAVSAGLIALTLVIMISKNMHIVDTEPAEEEQQISTEEGDTRPPGTQQEALRLSATRTADTADDLESVYENMHPCIVPMKEAAQDPADEDGLSNVTVHFSTDLRQEQSRTAKPPLEGATKPQGARHVAYSVLVRP